MQMKLTFCSTATLCAVTLVLYCQAQEEVDSRNVRFHGHENKANDACEVQGRHGVCKRRNRCKRPTRKICSLGLIPVVCCLEDNQANIENPQRPPSRPRPTPKPPTSRPRPIPKPPTERPRPTPKPVRGTTPKTPDANDVDILFPGCGYRAPKVSNARTNENARTGNQRNGGRFGRFRGRNRRGRKKRGIQPVIVGGVTAKPNSWPWMVAIFKRMRSSERFLCGASLISKQYILTAAHCFDKMEETSKYFIKVGAHDTSEGDIYDVQAINIHPAYKKPQYYNDMCLLKLKREVALNSRVYPVCLPSASLRDHIDSRKKEVVVTGWGDTTFGGKTSKVLQEVEMPIVPLKECNESYWKAAGSTFPQGITNLFICAGLKEGGKDACQGDSGGPLVMELERNDGTGQHVQLGVVSFGMGCAQPGFPGVYTRVSKQAKWIYENTDLGK